MKPSTAITPLPPDELLDAIVNFSTNSTRHEHQYIVHLEPIQSRPLQQPGMIYNHFDNDYKQHDIEKILTIENNPSTGELYVNIQWKND
jgi:hypothetical protein